MHFLPRPGGSTEDDGVLVTIVFDGPKEQVGLLEYLVLMTMMVTMTGPRSRWVLLIISIWF